MTDTRKQMMKKYFEYVKDYMENEGLDETLNHCYSHINSLGLLREMQMYIDARDNLESAILRLYEVYDTGK